MDLPFVYSNSPWPFYYPLPRQHRSRLPSISRGPIYEATPLTAARRQQRRQSANPLSRRRSSSSSSGTPLLAHTTTPNRGRQSTSRAMQATSGGTHRPAATAVPLRPSVPHLVWPHTPFDTNRPCLSFSRAATDLAATLDAALGYIRPVYDKFSEETEEVRKYADQTVMDQLWVKKVWDKNTHEGQHAGTNAGHGHVQGQGGGDEEGKSGRNDSDNDNRIETPAARQFHDHQAAVQNRCEDILCAIPPPVLQIQNPPRHGQGMSIEMSSSNSDSNSNRSMEAAALVAKMSRCRDDLFPALRRMGSRYDVVGPAIKEMEVLRASLETYHSVWDGSGEEGGV